MIEKIEEWRVLLSSGEEIVVMVDDGREMFHKNRNVVYL